MWNHLRLFLTNDSSLPMLTAQTAILGLINWIENNVYTITNHIRLVFKLYFHKSRDRGTIELSRLINEIKKVKLLERIQPKCKETGTA